MLTRTHTTTLANRASSSRRLRRRQRGAMPLYCGTNGCATILRLDDEAGEARCPICDFVRRLS